MYTSLDQFFELKDESICMLSEKTKVGYGARSGLGLMTALGTLEIGAIPCCHFIGHCRG
jgi:hypothetical protein